MVESIPGMIAVEKRRLVERNIGGEHGMWTVISGIAENRYLHMSSAVSHDRLRG